MTQFAEPAGERRERQRFGIKVPLTVLVGGREIPAYTRDLSNKGVYFHLAKADSSLINRDFDFMLELTPEITLSTSCLIRCQGRLVRTEQTAGELAGMAAEILHYSILKGPTASN